MPEWNGDRDVVAVNGFDLYLEVAGSGPLLVFVPGAAGDGGEFEAVAAHLTDRFTVVLYDRRGFSRSAAPANWNVTSTDEQADDVAALVRVLGQDPAMLLGNSSGATFALVAALRHPEVVAAAIAHEPPKVWLHPRREEIKAELRAEVAQRISAEGEEAALLAITEWLGTESHRAHAALLERRRANGPTWVRMELGAGIESYDLDGATFRVPLEVWVGDRGGTPHHEQLLGEYQEALRNLARDLGARYRVTKGAHTAHLEFPEEFAASVTAAAGDLGIL